MTPAYAIAEVTLPPRFTDWLRWMVAEQSWGTEEILAALERPYRWQAEWEAWLETREFVR